MTFKELCEARYSCRSYQDRTIESAKMDYIKECVRLAPSAVNRQPWRFVFVTDADQLALIKPCYKREWINEAPAIVVCLKNESECWTRRYDNKPHADIDLAIAIEHLCLAATEQGLGSCWVCNFDINMLREQYPMPEGYEPVALIPIGYAADETNPKVRKPMNEVWQ